MSIQLPVARASGWWALGLLGTSYLLSFVDRRMLSWLGESIRHELGHSDAPLGWLGGLAFVLSYSVRGVPSGFLSERMPRNAIIASAVRIWSALTMLCGLAGSFVALLVLRAGVGLGEAGLLPPARSVIADFFPPPRRAFVFALFGAAIPAGVLIAAMGGGWLTHAIAWRAAFIVVGAPGLVWAPLLSREMPLVAALRLDEHPNPDEGEGRIEGFRSFVETRAPIWKGR